MAHKLSSVLLLLLILSIRLLLFHLFLLLFLSQWTVAPNVHSFQLALLRSPGAPAAPAASTVQAQDEWAAGARVAEGAQVAAGPVGGAGVLLQVDGQQEGGRALVALVRSVNLVAAMHVGQDAACQDTKPCRTGQ